MPSINGICTLINNAMIAGQFASNRFQDAKWYGVADPIKKVENDGTTQIPLIVSFDGEGMNVAPTDNHAMVIYHRVIDLSYEVPPSDDYGTRGTYVQETAKMKMIWFIDKEALQVRQEDVVAAAHLNLPAEFLPTQVNPLNLLEVVIDWDGCDMDSYGVYESEFQNIQYNLTTTQIMFAINYTIISRYATCFTLC